MNLRWKLGAWVAVVGLLEMLVQTGAQEKPQARALEKPKYVGVEACGVCHKNKAKGDQLGKWQESKHAQAYAVLATPEAKEIAKKKGIADPQKADQCLKCHVTAHGVDPALIEPAAEGKKGHRVEDGVGCESCHGPGSLYKPRAIMKVRAEAVAKGLIIPDEKVCQKCHNPESPTYEKFVFAEMAKKIAHPIPREATGGSGN